jgi:hypothetical protein
MIDTNLFYYLNVFSEFNRAGSCFVFNDYFIEKICKK